MTNIVEITEDCLGKDIDKSYRQSMVIASRKIILS